MYGWLSAIFDLKGGISTLAYVFPLSILLVICSSSKGFGMKSSTAYILALTVTLLTTGSIEIVAPFAIYESAVTVYAEDKYFGLDTVPVLL